MRKTPETAAMFAEVIACIPDGQHFDCSYANGRMVEFQIATQAGFAEFRKCFPGIVWSKEWSDDTKWWEFVAEWRDWTLKVYACHEAPKTCRAITEVRTVTEQVPVTYKEVTHEKEVIVGWDCGAEEDQGAGD